MASLEIDKGWLKECMSFAEFCHFQLITLLKQETRLDLLGRGWFAHQFQSNLAREQNGRLSMRRKGPATQQHRCLHRGLHCTPCDLHQYCPRSACAPQTKLAMKHEKEVNWESNFISSAPLYFHTCQTFREPHLPSDIQRCHGIPNFW